MGVHHRQRIRGAWRRGSVGAAFTAAALLCWCSPALGLSQRGHAFAGTIGEPGSGDGQLQEPASVAVNEASGDVYVVDRANNRIERFDAAGKFLAAWGWGVADGKHEYEVCTSACKAGVPGHGKFELEGAQAIAVDSSTSPSDPSAGDVYLQAHPTTEPPEHEVIDKFSAAGSGLRVLKGIREPGFGLEGFEGLHGMTTDPAGGLWVYDEEDVFRLGDGEPNKLISEREPHFEVGEPAEGVAIDSQSHLYLAHEGVSGAGHPPTVVARVDGGDPEAPVEAEEVDSQNTTGFAADGSSGAARSGDVLLDHGSEVAVFDSAGQPVQRLGAERGESHLEGGAGVAVDARRGRVYVADQPADRVAVFALEKPGAPKVDEASVQDVAAGSAQIDLQIDPKGSNASYYVEYGPTASCAAEPSKCRKLAAKALGPGPDEGFGDVGVTVSLGGGSSPLEPATAYSYRVVASNEHQGGAEEQHEAERQGSFKTLPATGKFTADERVWELVSPPVKGGSGVEPLSREGAIIQAAQGGDAVTYVANGPIGEVEGSRSLEPTQMLSCSSRLASCAARVGGGQGWYSQDIVTPNEHGTGIQVQKPPEYQSFSADLSLALVRPFPGGGSLAEPPLSPPLTKAEEETGPAKGQEKTIYLRADQPLQPGPGAPEAGDYEQALANGELEHYPGYYALVTAANALPGFGQLEHQPRFAGASPDLRHVVLDAEAPLGSPADPGNNLYEWTAGALQLVSLLPGHPGAPAAKPALGASTGHSASGAISANGARVFWTAGGHLYMRDTAKQETLQIDTVQLGATGSGAARPIFQAANADGSRVLFTDEQQLTPGSGAGGVGDERGRADLYSCDVEEVNAELSCRLLDVTPARAGESASVQGLALGASEDGSYVYFVANGVLSNAAVAAGASPGQCRVELPPSAGCNLYMDHYDSTSGEWEAATFVARLSGADLPAVAVDTPSLTNLAQVTSRVSTSGRYLAFMSSQSLTGYDNRDANPAAKGARDEEVFLYDAREHQLVCASCNPSGARPRGVYDPEEGQNEGPEGFGLLADRAAIWQGHWLAGSIPGWTKLERERATYQSRVLSDKGRLFFNSPADLVPEAVNGKEDVYEYEPLGVPGGSHRCSAQSATYSSEAKGCIGLISSGVSSHESAFLDASESGGEAEGGKPLDEGGGDVYFVTAERLTTQDVDSSLDVYDAHECMSASPCLFPSTTPPPAPCLDTSSCRPFTPPSLQGLVVASGAGQSTGNLPPRPNGGSLGSKAASKPQALTRSQKLARALKACRKRKPRHRRLTCEAQARKSYGRRTKGKSSHASRAAFANRRAASARNPSGGGR